MASDIYGNRVAVSITGMGKLARKGDWQSLGAAIIDVLDEPEKFVKPREFIKDIFSFDKTVNEYEAIFFEYANS